MVEACNHGANAKQLESTFSTPRIISQTAVSMAGAKKKKKGFLKDSGSTSGCCCFGEFSQGSSQSCLKSPETIISSRESLGNGRDTSGFFKDSYGFQGILKGFFRDS